MADEAGDQRRVQVPSLSGPYDRMIIACADLTTSDKKAGAKILSATGIKPETIYATSSGSGALGLLEVAAEALETNHVHIEVVAPVLLGETPPNVPDDEAQQLLSALLGQEVEGRFTGRFEVPVSDLPKVGLIHPVLETMILQVGDTAIRQTGARFTVLGGSLREISWHHMPKAKTVRVELFFHVKTVIDAAFLTSRYEEAARGLQRWILGVADAAATKQ